MCAEKEYLEVKKDIKDHEKKIEDLEEDYQRLLDKVDLTASEKYRKDNFERRKNNFETQLAELKKDKYFWMSQMKILQQKTVAPTGTLKQSTPVPEESISEKLTDSEEKLQKKVWK